MSDNTQGDIQRMYVAAMEANKEIKIPLGTIATNLDEKQEAWMLIIIEEGSPHPIFNAVFCGYLLAMACVKDKYDIGPSSYTKQENKGQIESYSCYHDGKYILIELTAIITKPYWN